jgi:hypothetical protein
MPNFTHVLLQLPCGTCWTVAAKRQLPLCSCKQQLYCMLLLQDTVVIAAGALQACTCHLQRCSLSTHLSEPIEGSSVA